MTATAVVRREPIDPVSLGRLLVVMLYADAGIALLGAATTGWDIASLGAMDPGTPASFTSQPPTTALEDGLRGLASLLELVAFFVIGFLALKWIYRVSRNAHALADGLTIKPGWAVGWYFVPFANLVAPFRAMKETWQASTNPTAWRSVPTPGLLRWWWGLWLTSNILGNLAFRLSFAAKSVGDLIVPDWAELISHLLDAPLDLTFAVVVQRLSAMQRNALSGRVFG